MNNIIDKKAEKKIHEFLEKQGTQDILSKIEENSDYNFKVVVTTEGVDRDGEVLEAGGIDFKAYMNNPVVLINHEYKVESVVAKTTKIYQENGKTIAEGVFAKGIEKAELIRSLYNQGFIKTVSIGFIATERSSENRDVISKSEMLEFSFVAVPANPEALSLDGKSYEKCLEAGIVKKEMNVDKSIDTQIREELKEKGIERCYIVDLFIGYVIYVTYDDNYENQKYFKQSYSITGDEIKLEGENEEVEMFSAWQEKFLSRVEKFDNASIVNNIKGIQNDIGNIKESLKTFSEDNEKKVNREKAQEIVKAVSGYLRDTK